MKNIIFNLKELFGYSNLAVNPDGQPTVKRRSKITYICCLFAFLTLGVGQAWGANQRYIYVGISSNYQTYKDNSNYGFNFWGGTSGGVKSGTYIAEYTWDSRKYYMYRVQVYDDNNKAQFKGNNSWYDPGDGFSVTLNGTTNNAVFFSHSSDGWGGQFQQNYQVTSTASLSATSTSITTVGSSTLTPSLSSNATYNEIKSTSYSVTTNPGSGGSVTSAGVFTATKAGTYTVTATITYNAKDFSGITKTATATKTITVTAAAETTYGVTFNAGANGSISAKGTAISAGSNATIQIGATARPLTATPSDGYRFAGWTKTGSVTIADPSSDNTTVSATGTGTVTATWAAKTPVRLYFSNPDGWATVKAYVWKDATTVTDKNADWPGVAITTNTVVNNCNTFYYYEYYKEDHPDWNRVIFNDGSSNQTSDITFSNTTNNGQYYVGSSWTATPGSRWALAHSIDSYNTTTHPLTCASTTSGSVDVVLAGNTEYQFKFVDTYTNTWYGVTSPTKITYTNKGTAQTMNNTGSSSNQTMTSAGAGTYRFTWDITNKKVKITYPTSYTVEFEVGTVKGNVNNPIIYHTSVDNANKVTSGKYVAEGTKVIFWIANSKETAPKAGYNWWGFYNNAAGTGSNLPEKYTDNTVSVYTINSIAADAHVYAVFGEKDYWITPYIVGEGSISPYGANGHVATKVSFTATPGTGYKFDNWTQRSGALTIESPYNATTNVNATAASELQANFSPKYAVRVKTGGGAWSDESANHLTGYGAGQIGYVDITLNANTDYEIQVFDRQTSKWYGGSATQNIYYANSNTEYTIATTSSSQSVFIKTGAAGTYRFAWNLTGYKIAVEYPTSRFIEIGQNIAEAGSVTAVDGESNTIVNGQAIRDGGSITFTITTVNTGYEFVGWYSNEECTTPYTHNGSTIVINDAAKTLRLTNVTAELTKVYAKFTPKTYAITLNQTGAKTEGSTSVTATYNTALPVPTLPTPADGYAFMGYFSEENGAGTQFTDNNGAWISGITDYIDANGKWIRDGGATLYAYFKKAEITALTLTPSVAAPGTTVTATPTIAPSPSGNIKLCWKILRSNGNLYTDDGFTPGEGNSVSFTAPAAGGTYKVVCVMHTGTSCDGGTELDTKEVDLVVASAHTVTIRYQDSDGRTLAPSREIEGRPLDWSEAITPAAITGYSFTRWDAGDGVIISTNKSAEVSTTTTATIYMKANYDGTLTAVYNKKNILYFNNTLGWEHVYVYFYKDGTYWSNDKNSSGNTAENVYGSGTNTSYFSGSYKGQYGEMTRIEGTNIFYFDYQAAGYDHTNYITFTKDLRNNYNYFDNTEVVRLADANHYFDKPGTMPMYVPLTTKYEIRNKHGESSTKYYTEGYWMNYPENTGYTLKIFDKVSGTPAPVVVQDIPFEFTADKTMPMSLTVELNANTTYGFKIYRNDGSWYGNNGTMKINHSGDEGQTAWEFTTGTNNCGLKTSAAGDYTFTLKYDEKTAGNYYYLVGVHYPASVGSYRLVYTDDNANLWSGNAKPSGWYHPSRVIYKNEGAADTVSFFVSKGSSPQIQIQKIRTIDGEGNITWENVGSATSYDTVSAAGVYNFITSQTASALTIDKVEPYTGNYYIRTGAVDGGWDNYRTGSDHLMTYSAFSEDRAQNTFGELFSHYKAKWCPRGTNVVFCIANDYSSCISDTLIQDIGNPYNNIYQNDEGGRPDGELKAESYNGSGNITSGETTDKYSANIRFMWNRSTNKISRAYVSSSTNTTKKFLILKGGATFWNSDGSILSGSGESHANHEAIFKDNENWIYEREIRVTTGTRFKLYACYAETTPSEENAQYFRGAYDGGNIDSNTNSIILIGGDGTGTCNARLIYDFKTNRLIAAYLPDGSAVSGSTSIDADLMIIREHQGEGQQITFASSTSTLDKVKTVYGVMRFNRWILNNRQNPEDHDKEHSKTDDLIATNHPLLAAGSQKSADERGLYWISFPFDVNLSEVFGFGTYGTHWIIMQYNGAERARQGFWADSEGFWEYIWDRNGVVLKGGMGYVLALELDLMKATDRTFWSNEIQQVELFFPSTSTAGTIKQTTATVEVPAHECTIDRTGSGGTSTDINKNRTKVDSHWNIIGVPSYANYGTELTDEGGTVTWNDNTSLKWTQNLPFLYEWNANDNTYTVQSGTRYPFKAMHAYYVQYHGTLEWSLASATSPSPIVARRTYAEAPLNEEFRLEIRRNDKMEDQTFVKLSNDEEVSANFVFGEDMTKEKNAGKANIYTIVENYLPVAGNTLPMSNQTTVVPVGVTIESTGDYTFAIPDGTDGIGVTLIDEETGIRTSLGALSYTVNLPKGNYNNRFVMEISPIKTITTGIDEVPSNQGPSTNARKVMIDGILYIVKDGKMYDARGTLVR